MFKWNKRKIIRQSLHMSLDISILVLYKNSFQLEFIKRHCQIKRQYYFVLYATENSWGKINSFFVSFPAVEHIAKACWLGHFFSANPREKITKIGRLLNRNIDWILESFIDAHSHLQHAFFFPPRTIFYIPIKCWKILCRHLV